MMMYECEACVYVQGADQGFSFRGGAKDVSVQPYTRHEREARSPLQSGGGGGGGGVDALSCYLSLIFKHSDTKWDTKKQSIKF